MSSSADSATASPSPVEDQPARRGGPKTPAGKAASSRNATTHGIFSTLPIIPGVERPEDWETLRARVRIELQPEGVIEESLAEHLAHLLWRRQRVWRYATAVAAREEANPDADPLSGSHADNRVIRYENHLTRQIHSTRKHFDTLQRARRGEMDSLTRLDRAARAYAPVFNDPDAAGWDQER